MTGYIPGFTIRIKAPTEAAAWLRYLRMSDKGQVPSFYDLKVTEVAPANESGNKTYEVKPLQGRDE
jgi:hypothetical protein